MLTSACSFLRDRIERKEHVTYLSLEMERSVEEAKQVLVLEVWMVEDRGEMKRAATWYRLSAALPCYPAENHRWRFSGMKLRCGRVVWKTTDQHLAFYE